MMSRKKIATVLLLLALPVLVFWGCDKIEEPYMKQPGENGNTEEVVRKILLEEFTGHRCPNCPQGAQMAKLLKSVYGDRLVTVSIHAGFFSNPLSSPFNYDFRTPEGNALNAHFGVVQNPTGMVNRTEFEGSRLLSPAAWGSAMTVFEDMDPGFALRLSASKGSAASYSLAVEVEALQEMQGDFYLVAVIIEDGIIKPQKTDDLVNHPTGEILDYEHNHVLRTGITGIWGEKLNENSMDVGQKVAKSYTFTLNSQWVPENCSVVAYVMNPQMEILQVEELKLP